jgi:diadenosine tetraphosphate (Ap4A) HIT family hydrolase
MANDTPRAETLLETDYWRVLLNPDQQNLGKSLVVLKSDKSALSQLSDDEWKEFSAIVKSFETALMALFNPTHFNWQCLMNNAYGQGSTESPHVHWHVVPRYAQSVNVAGYEFIDKNYPRTNKEPVLVDNSVYNDVARLIQDKLQGLVA